MIKAKLKHRPHYPDQLTCKKNNNNLYSIRPLGDTVANNNKITSRFREINYKRRKRRYKKFNIYYL